MHKLCRSRLKPPVLPDDLLSHDILIAAFQHLKLHYEVLSVLMTEVSALRETLLQQNGIRFAKELSKRETKGFKEAAPLERELFASYDEVIRRIKETS